MSPANPTGPRSTDDKGEIGLKKPTPPRKPRLRGDAHFWAGVLIIVIVGGIAFNISFEALTENCTSEPSTLALYAVPSCGNLLVIAVAGAIIGGIAVGLGVLLLRRAGAAPWRLPLAAGIFLALLLVVAGIPIALAPSPVNLGELARLPFPIPIGTTFNASQFELDAFAEAPVPLDPYAPWAPIYIVGGYNATETVCVYIARAAGPDLGPGAHSACGTSVTFAFGVTSSTWIISFYVPQTMTGPFRANVVITQSVEIVY